MEGDRAGKGCEGPGAEQGLAIFHRVVRGTASQRRGPFSRDLKEMRDRGMHKSGEEYPGQGEEPVQRP